MLNIIYKIIFHLPCMISRKNFEVRTVFLRKRPSSKSYLSDNAGINFIHNHPPRTPGICTKNLPPPWGFSILTFVREAGICWGSSEGRAFVCKRFLPFLEFSYNGKNWRLTALWGLFVALKVYTFLKQIIQTWIEPKLKTSKWFF